MMQTRSKSQGTAGHLDLQDALGTHGSVIQDRSAGEQIWGQFPLNFLHDIVSKEFLTLNGLDHPGLQGKHLAIQNLLFTGASQSMQGDGVSCLFFLETHMQMCVHTLISMNTRTQPYPYEHLRETELQIVEIDKITTCISLSTTTERIVPVKSLNKSRKI